MSSQSILITGCSAGGIGHALALSFQARNFTVFATARSTEKMEDLAALPNMHLLPLDVTSPVSINTAKEKVSELTGGKLDVLINNAGQVSTMPVLDVDIDEAKQQFEVNYWGTLLMVQAFGDMLIAAKGCIINVGSLSGVLPLPFSSQYNASKAAAIHLSETLRIELMPLNVRVITLMPGGVESNIFANGPPPTELPKGSYYLPIEKQLARPVIFDKMETAKFARCVVESVLNGHSGKVWRGASAGMVSWMVRFMPQWLLDKIMFGYQDRLKHMPKRT